MVTLSSEHQFRIFATMRCSQGEANCDDKITEQEKTYSRAIDKLRNESKSIPIKDPIVSDFLCHLSRRSRPLRQFSTKVADFAIEGISKSFSEEQNVIKLMRKRNLIKFCLKLWVSTD